jgi:NTE family protein
MSETTAFVLSGGGNLGAVQVGMVQALYSAGITPDLIVGTSVGSVNGSWLAAHGRDADVDQLADVWHRMRRSDIFPTQLVGGLLGFLGRTDHLVSSAGLRKVLRKEVPIRQIEDAAIPLRVIATDIATGHDVCLQSGDVADAVCASSAIPGVFPSVKIGGQTLVDGGVVNNCPISHALDAGATRIYVLPCGYACALADPPKGALATVLQAVSLLVQNRLIIDVERYRDVVDLRVVPTLCPLKVSPTDFGQAKRMIIDSRALTESWLQDPAVGQQPGLHHH